MSRKRCFDPVVDARTRVLVLGSLPGEASLKAGRYYAHPRNLFWRLIGPAIGADLTALDYEARLSALLDAGVGLWDVVAEAERPGSLDGAIRDARPSDLPGLLATLPALRAVAFNGRKAAALGTAALHGSALDVMTLPSSSPANAGTPFEAKARAWREIACLL